MQSVIVWDSIWSRATAVANTIDSVIDFPELGDQVQGIHWSLGRQLLPPRPTPSLQHPSRRCSRARSSICAFKKLLAGAREATDERERPDKI